MLNSDVKCTLNYRMTHKKGPLFFPQTPFLFFIIVSFLGGDSIIIIFQQKKLFLGHNEIRKKMYSLFLVLLLLYTFHFNCLIKC